MSLYNTQLSNLNSDENFLNMANILKKFPSCITCMCFMASKTLQHFLIIERSNFDEKAFKQMKRACLLPFSVILSMLGDLHIPYMLYIIKIKSLSVSSLEYIFYIQFAKSIEEIII